MWQINLCFTVAVRGPRPKKGSQPEGVEPLLRITKTGQVGHGREKDRRLDQQADSRQLPGNPSKCRSCLESTKRPVRSLRGLPLCVCVFLISPPHLALIKLQNDSEVFCLAIPKPVFFD
ncbi:hypothetical protein DPEC_G00117710 [Dallia pectoralis]|uniref:Uncharacterized protein n=1 Tax=Dallia pectoralis TaxID=75939 RepID=A0ACC2GV20_DALPE|nr:hypothetical protein DPEC_G00117710 [Dallia pectoralis]